MPSDNTVAVIGAGAWGTALAGVAARAGRDVILYARNAENAAQMKLAHANPRLPGLRQKCSFRYCAMLSTPALVRVSAKITIPSRTRIPQQ